MQTAQRQTAHLTTPLLVESVPPNAIDAVWQDILPMVQRGLSHGEGDTITAETIRCSVASGNMLAWAVREGDKAIAVVFFRVRQEAHGRSLFIVMLAGTRMNEWVDEVEEMLQDYRDIIGARCIRASCRLGLARNLAKRGWKKKAIIMEAPK